MVGVAVDEGGMDGRERSGCGWVEMVLENELEMEWMANTPHLLEVEEEEEVGRPAHPAEGYIVQYYMDSAL